MIRNTRIVTSFVAVLIVVSLFGLASYINTQRLISGNKWLLHTHQVVENLQEILSVLKDAETGQRGYILSGQDHYLEPYNIATSRIESRFAILAELIQDDAVQQSNLDRLQRMTALKLDELKQTIELRRRSGLDAAMPIILSDRGKNTMDDIRGLVSRMDERERADLQLQQKDSESRARMTMWTIAAGLPLSLLVLAVAALTLTGSGLYTDAIAGLVTKRSLWEKRFLRYFLAIVAAVLAGILRQWLLHFGPLPLYITFYPAVLLVATISGGGPGIITTVLSGFITLYYFITPHGQFSIESPSDLLALAIFIGTNLTLCVIAERLRRARWAEAMSIAKQQESEELAKKNEELVQQSEELLQQSEELAQQNEELQSQSEEIQTLNTELTGRENMLRKLLEAARLHHSEESVLKEVCSAAKDILGSAASAVVICEKKGEALFIRAQAGSRETPKPWAIEGSFPGLVMQEGRTACLNDSSLRPDLKLLQVPEATPFQSALSTPLRVGSENFGAVTVYGLHKQQWTEEQFRLVEWLATQCGHILETLKLQDQLRATADQNRLLSDLLEHSEQPFGIGYPDGRLGYVNAAFERLTGYTRPELETMDWANVLTPPQWRSIEQEKLKELQSTGQSARYAKEYARKDGTCIPIELLVHLIKDGKDQPLYYYSFITDISERKKTEAEVQKLAQQRQLALDASHLGWWHFDPLTQVSSWDVRYREIFGVSGHSRPNEEILKRLHPEDLPGVWAKVEAALNPADPKPYSAEYRINLPDGSMKWIEAHGVATFDGKDSQRRAVALVGTVADISERKRAEELLRDTNTLLEQRVEERTKDLAQRAAQLRALAGELTMTEQRERSRLARVLHDHLQQLLVAAKFRLAILGKGAEDLIKKAITEVESLVDESIAASRSLTAELSPPILHEAGLKEGLEWLARRMADKQGLIVDLEMEDIAPLPDDLKIMLFESVRELLFNIVKHAHTHSASLNLRRVDGLLQLTISDEGDGFDPNALPKPGESGHGFGLFSVRERLELFEGSMEIQSAPAQGSRIFLSVPIPEHSIAPKHVDQPPVSPEIPVFQQRSGPAPDKKIRVLLADDHSVVRQGIAAMLGMELDMEVVGGASTGHEAIALAEKLLPDVILMDMSMPVLNGIEATRTISRDYPEIRIIGLSMFEDSERAQAMRDAGASDYLMKSGPAEELLRAIRDVIHHR